MVRFATRAWGFTNYRTHILKIRNTVNRKDCVETTGSHTRRMQLLREYPVVDSRIERISWMKAMGRRKIAKRY